MLSIKLFEQVHEIEKEKTREETEGNNENIKVPNMLILFEKKSLLII